MLGDWADARKISMTSPPAGASLPVAAPSRRRELLTFFILAFAIWPVVAVMVVGGYGFLVWMYQIVFGPPGPPAGMH
jgi:nitrate reductase NapE